MFAANGGSLRRELFGLVTTLPMAGDQQTNGLICAVILRVNTYKSKNKYLILTEYEVNIGNKSREKDRGEAEKKTEAKPRSFTRFLFPILTKYEVNIRFITTNSPYFKFQNDNLMNPGFMIAQPLHHHLLMQ